MKLNPPLQIDERKLTHYLLVFRDKDDKSNYLRSAGYELDNWPILEKDLLLLADTSDAVFVSNSVFGDSYEVVGSLTGPNERQLMVKSIWIQEKKTGFTKFITLYPP